MANFKYALPVLLEASGNAPLFVAMADTQRGIPMAIGISTTILDSATPEDRKKIKRAFGMMAASGRYLKALLDDGAMRYGLDGKPTEPVAEEHRAFAREIKAKRTAFHEARARRNEAKRAPPQPARPILKLSARP